MSRPTEPATISSVSVFLIEIHMADAGELEVERAARMLDAAQIRMRGSPTVTRSLESARRLVRMALLPAGRIREITHPAGTLLLGSHPGGDVDPGVESELVQDVVDVGLDGALGQE